MIARLGFAAQMISLAAALWILAVVFWGLATGEKQVTPVLAIWIFIAGMLARLALWLISKMARQS